MIRNLEYQARVIQKSAQDKRIIALAEKILSKTSIRNFVDECKKQMTFIFDCERVNMILVDRFRRVFFKIVYDESNNIENIVSYPIEQSLATSTVISGHAIFTDDVTEETRYSSEIDDPEGHKNPELSPARQILTCPIFALTD